MNTHRRKIINEDNQQSHVRNSSTYKNALFKNDLKMFAQTFHENVKELKYESPSSSSTGSIDEHMDLPNDNSIVLNYPRETGMLKSQIT